MPIKLRYKVNLVILITFVLIAVVFSSILIPIQQRRMETSVAHIETMIGTLVQQAKEALANEIFEQRRRAIKLRLEQMLQLEGMLALTVFDSTGKPLVSSSTSELPSKLSATDQETADSSPYFQIEPFKGVKAVRFLGELSVGGDKIGFVQIHYSLSDTLQEHRQDLLILIFLFASVLVVMLLLLNLLFSRTIISPITKLRNLMTKVQKDGLGEQVPIQSSDEIGDLARAFNQMSDALLKSYRKINAQTEKLQLSEKMFKDAEKTAHIGSFSRDIKTNKVSWSDEQYRIFGYKAGEVKPTFEFIKEHVHPDDQKKFLQANELLITEKVPYNLEYRLIQKNGDVRTVRSKSNPEFDVSGVLVRQYGALQDITDQKRDEEELKKHREHLEEMVEIRTKELKSAQDELIRRERLATLGQLTATVAHEIRNPLGTVRNSVFSIGSAIKRKEMIRVDRALSLAERNIQRCDGIIAELLDFTRQRKLKKAPMDIDVWLENLMGEYQLPEEIEYKPEMKSGTLISFDPEYLGRAVINVITNAVQAMEEESLGKELQLKTAVVKNKLEIRIVDTGPGIPGDVREKIFDLLFSTKNFGVGLGLAIVKDVMAEHGGGVEIESEVNIGTEVVMWLPIN